jgi:LmbE family N-acetylglucosaminyl deacetylase
MPDAYPIPYDAHRSPPPGRVLVLAPHPDDEVFGCGGAILRHVAQGDPVQVVVVTAGGFEAEGQSLRPDYVAARQTESRAAAAIMGYGDPVFWSWPDQGLAYGEALIGELLSTMQAFEPTHLYLPAHTEVHPDHQALCAAATEAARRYGALQSLYYYEVGQPLMPNFLLDISDLCDKLDRAMQTFTSQLARHNYLAHMQGLRAFRTYTLPRTVTAAEAYYCVPANQLAGPDAMDSLALPRYDLRQPDALAAHRRPLISVIVRSVGDPYLPQALASIAAQTYPRVEVILVDAAGEGNLKPGAWSGRFPLRTVSEGKPLSRPEAANAGLEAIKGDFFAFLDDDDFWWPHHLHALHAALADSPAVAAYAPMAWQRADGREGLLGEEFFFPFALIGNTCTNHAVLFRAEVWQAGCQFDPELAVYEDWEFLLQARTVGPFVQVATPGGVYRMGDRSGVHHANERRARCKAYIWQKWQTRLGQSDLFTGLLLPELEQLRLRYQQACQEKAVLRGRIESLEQSRSWRYTRRLRRLFDLFNPTSHA